MPTTTPSAHPVLQASGVRAGYGGRIILQSLDLQVHAGDIADRIGFIGAGRLAEEVAATGVERFDVRALHRRYAQEAAA